ncbi:MAG: PRC-barrel domain-containing protein [Actinomycetota bacterium]
MEVEEAHYNGVVGKGLAMLQSARSLNGFIIRATDGKIGHVEECYFDDGHSAIRYLVVNTGSWLLGRRVLISPVAITAVERSRQAIEVSLTRSQVADSPEIDTAEPLTRPHEANYLGYFGWPLYWTGGLAWGAAAYPGLVIAPPSNVARLENSEPEPIADESAAEERSHLRSTREVTGYGVVARDGEIGHVEDFLIDDHAWTIRYLAVDPKNFWPGNPVLIPPSWLSDVTWSAASVRVDHTRAEIESAPEWDPARPLNREFEEALHRHYQRPGYWSTPTDLPPAATADETSDEEDLTYTLPPA